MAGHWPRFFAFLWTETKSTSIKTQKKELGQYPVILTSRLVNNAYIMTCARVIFASHGAHAVMTCVNGCKHCLTSKIQ